MSIELNKKEMSVHIGHDIVCVGYALKDEDGNRVTDWENVAIECETCGIVLVEDVESTEEDF